MTNAQLKAHRFAFRQFTQFLDKAHQLNGVGEFAVVVGRHAIGPNGYTSGACNLGGDFGAQEHATVTGLGTLAELDLDHFDLITQGVDDKLFWAEVPLLISATKVTRGDFPNQISSMHTVVLRNRSLTRVMGKAA